MRPLGKKQLQFLVAYKKHQRVRFRPARHGQPWPVMKSLAKRGLIWMERVDRSHWLSGIDEWKEDTERDWWFGLTTDGLMIANREIDRRADAQ